MFHTQDNKNTDQVIRSSEFYQNLENDIMAVIEGENNLVANLGNISAILFYSLAQVNWAGFYMWHKESQELVLGPFQGKPACIRIKNGRGVCGAASKELKTQLVKNVHDFPGHIACDSASLSEIVIPIFNQNNELQAVLDIDSPILQRFTEEDQSRLEQIVQKFSKQLVFKL